MSELRLVFLGTSSGKPTLSRGLPSVALMFDGALVLFDCGEGTQLQFMRAGLRPSRLLLACISHYHGDHINGLPGFLSTMALNQHEKPVVVIAPRGLTDYFRVLRRLGIYVPRFAVTPQELEQEGEVFRGDHFRITAAKVHHRIETWAFRFDEDERPGRFNLESARQLGVPHGPLFGQLQRGEAVTLADGRIIHPEQVMGERRPGRSVAIITDTRPCESAVRLARGADLLIHESTYAPELATHAQERGHCTAVEAAEVARQAEVKRLILTHISPKHDDARPLLAAAKQIFPNTTVAKDLMEVVLPLGD